MKSLGRFRLKAGSQEEYLRRHDEIWPEMTELIREAGLSRYSIWNVGDELFEYLETDDEAALERTLAESPVKRRWDAYMSDLLIYEGPGGKASPLKLMFDIDRRGK
jgi:L-rhamnose mutarotase